jgi:hypothetical protein
VVTVVVDRGVSSSRDNLACLQRAARHYIPANACAAGRPHAAEALSRQGRYQQVCDSCG